MSLVLPPAVPKPASVPSPRNSRPSSIDLGVGSASVALTIASSLVDNHGYPRSSILLNARKRTYKGLVYANDPKLSPVAPVVTHIPAVPSRKHKEKEREREREREKERESLKPKSKDDVKIWGIPKKALYLGLSDLSFQTSGRSPLSSSSIPAQQSSNRKRRKSSSSKRSDKAEDSDDDDDEDEEERQSMSSSRKSADNAADAEEPMDPEELAALNAIINTRRSMAAAQALVSGQLSTGSRSVRGSSFGSADRPRPPFDRQRFASQESVPSVSSFAHSSTSSINNNNDSNALALPTDDRLGASSSAAESSLKSPTSEQNRIRFAPLPQPTAPVQASRRPVLDGNGQPLPLGGSDDELNDSDLSDSDFDTDDEETKSMMKGKWYLMGMPPAVFTSQYYTGKSSRRSKLPRTGSVSSFGGEDDQDDGGSLHRKSTSSLNEVFSSDALRKVSASSDVDDDTRGRASSSSIKSKRSKSQPRRRSRSRNGAISSGDEDERARRRQLIRLARPGGTGMVTLPDGTKIRARRVNDNVDTEEPEFIEWGFAGLAREASRRGMGGSNPASLATTPNEPEQNSLSAFMAAEEDEEDDGSGMAWVRRRRREREERARLEREKAASEESIPTPAQGDVDSVADVQTPPEKEPAAPALEMPPSRVVNRKDSVQTASPLLPSASPEESAQSTEAAIVAQASDHGSTRRPSLIEGPHQAPFADPVSLPASPKVDATPAMDASIISEASFGEKATPMSGSQLLNKVYQGAAGDTTPRHTAPGLSLSANQAEIIRKRHEDEVAALGAEVLAQNRRNTQRRQASTAVALFTGTAPTSADASADLTSKNMKAAQSTSGTTTPSANVSASRDSAFEKNPLARAVGSIMRKATAESDRTVRSGNEDGGKKQAEPALPLVSEPISLPEAPASPGVSQQLSPKMRSQSPESTLSHKSSSLGEPTSPATNKSMSSLHASSSIPSTHSPMNKRMATNASISTPAPSPWLPRRPDARGMAVVPLPQLGVRPERPREGRVWQFDVSDDSDAAAEGASDKEDEEISDLDAEELEEEELKTAMQKKRATTRAAGQEVVHTSLESKATSRAASKMSSSFDLEPVRQPKVPSTASKRRSTVAGTRNAGPAQPSAPRKAPPRLVRSSTTSRRHADDGDDDEDSEKDLWPAASATSKTGTPRPRHILVNLPGGPGIWDSKTGGGRNAVAAINSVAAARAKAIKKRADKGTSFELPPGWDDEMMDYGWPRSLKGSLY